VPRSHRIVQVMRETRQLELFKESRARVSEELFSSPRSVSSCLTPNFRMRKFPNFGEQLQGAEGCNHVPTPAEWEATTPPRGDCNQDAAGKGDLAYNKRFAVFIVLEAKALHLIAAAKRVSCTQRSRKRTELSEQALYYKACFRYSYPEFVASHVRTRTRDPSLSRKGEHLLQKVGRQGVNLLES
jgi:hypothetical protein